jgi:hydroxymethylpyrimidine pyrophosphatase-like HAD family hydrolase
MSLLAMGLIAIDIDGTLTGETHAVYPEVVKKIHSYASSGWEIYFVTGRSFTWAMQTLEEFTCPFYLSVQNGSLIIEMPKRKILSRNYLSTSVIEKLDVALGKEYPDFALYSGFEGNDVVYYRDSTMEYPLKRAQRIGEKWVKLPDFHHLPFSQLPAIKWFGNKDVLESLSERLSQVFDWHAPVIKDPIDPSYCILQASSPMATKGHSIDHFRGKTPLIAAGDDLNDYPMLIKADYKVVMQGAPEQLLAIADVVAPSVHEKGLIDGLDEIMKRLGK